LPDGMIDSFSPHIFHFEWEPIQAVPPQDLRF
jgi:hypothetical protein